MNIKRIIGFVLLIGATIWFVNKFLTSISGQLELGIGFYFIGVVGFILLLGIRQILRS